ncbi:MAG: 50S ribosomal protein L9 [Candidatus Cloacimonetes bacterium]|nr:50S ribosomal protein L9 [Candidatus Cloacimonadota bacterium]
MKVILIKDVKKLGDAGNVVKVSDGYARNFLIPQQMAILANANNLSQIEEIRKKAELEKLEIENRFKALALKINEVELNFTRKADENDHLFGSVSEADIAKALQEKEIEVHKSHIEMDKHLKQLGSFEVPIVFTSEITATLKVNITKEE